MQTEKCDVVKLWDYWAFPMGRAKGRMCCLDGKEKNVLFDDDFELVYITLYIVCALAIKHNI